MIKWTIVQLYLPKYVFVFFLFIYLIQLFYTLLQDSIQLHSMKLVDVPYIRDSNKHKNLSLTTPTD